MSALILNRSLSEVRKAPRFALFFEQATKRRGPLEGKAGRLGGAMGEGKAGRLTYIIGLSALLMCGVPALADPVPAAVPTLTIGAADPHPFTAVNQLGESDQQAALREGQLLSHRRATDPFGNTIRGPYKALPVVEQPAAVPGQPTGATPATPVVVTAPTLEQAVRELTIGAVNVGAHEILVGSRLIREGDLLVLESGGRQFAVWVQDIGVRGVLFCDIDLQKHLLKPFGSGPRELPGDSVWGVSNIDNFSNKDASQ
jgi:hypothetical protein